MRGDRIPRVKWTSEVVPAREVRVGEWIKGIGTGHRVQVISVEREGHDVILVDSMERTTEYHHSTHLRVFRPVPIGT